MRSPLNTKRRPRLITLAAKNSSRMNTSLNRGENNGSGGVRRCEDFCSFVFRGLSNWLSCVQVIVECQKHPEYQESLEWLITFIKEYASHGRNFSQSQLDNTTSNAPSSLNKSLHQLKTILERFASNKSFDRLIIDPINALIDDAKRDPELESWWKEVGIYLERCVKEPGYVTEPQCEAEGRKLEDTGKIFFGNEARPDLKGDEVRESAERGKYREHLDRVFEGAKEFVAAIGQDPMNKR